MSAVRIARYALLVGIVAYATILGGLFFKLIEPGVAVVLTACAVLVMAVSALAALSLQIWSGIRRKR